MEDFKNTIKNIINKDFPGLVDDIIDKSQLVQYLIRKTVSANRDSKARSSFANIYAVYVLVEDYVKRGYFKPTMDYSKYDGAKYSDLFNRMRELPFGDKLQNHALNNRMSAEFHKFFPATTIEPIPRDLKSKRYWINDKLLRIVVNKNEIDIAKTVLKIIDKYIEVKKQSFVDFIKTCKEFEKAECKSATEAKDFIASLIKPTQDARIFEIVSYSILKFFYSNKKIYWGYTRCKVKKDNLRLYKTGRTNANDGGIDFVMRPLGRFFQVTETLDFSKYFLDIDKIERFPITFVVKSSKTVKEIEEVIRSNAIKAFSITKVVDRYMRCVEEIINIPLLMKRLDIAEQRGHLKEILNEVVIQSKVEFNLDNMFE